MPDIRGQLLPIYVLADESGSMNANIAELNTGLTSLYQALLGEPMAAAKVRLSVLGFSDTVEVRLRLADLRRVSGMPQLVPRSTTNYLNAFAVLRQQITEDVQQLKTERYEVHRPAVVFLSDGLPDANRWRDEHRNLTDRTVFPLAPNIIACGVGEAEPSTILTVATDPKFAFVALGGARVGPAIAAFCTELTKSVVKSGLSVGTGSPTLTFQMPQGFQMAIDVV